MVGYALEFFVMCPLWAWAVEAALSSCAAIRVLNLSMIKGG